MRELAIGAFASNIFPFERAPHACKRAAIAPLLRTPTLSQPRDTPIESPRCLIIIRQCSMRVSGMRVTSRGSGAGAQRMVASSYAKHSVQACAQEARQWSARICGAFSGSA